MCALCRTATKGARKIVRPYIALSKVRCAITRGALPHWRGLKCTDCEFPASGYEHRWYSRPLDVEPICQPCNVMRGMAYDLREEFWKLRGLTRYTSWLPRDCEQPA